MIVKTKYTEYQCVKAERYGEDIYLYYDDLEQENPNTILSSPTITEVIDGEIIIVEAPEPTESDDINALIVDHEYRLTLLELGITE